MGDRISSYKDTLFCVVRVVVLCAGCIEEMQMCCCTCCFLPCMDFVRLVVWYWILTKLDGTVR